MMPFATLLVILLLHSVPTAIHAKEQTAGDHLADRFPPPPGATRVPATAGSLAHYLRHLPMKPIGTAVFLYDGTPKGRQDVHSAVVDLGTGRKDLQQCADVIMRLRAEYLFETGQEDKIAFHFTNGFLAEWKRWRRGERIHVDGNTCSWKPRGTPDGSHAQLLSFLEVVFTYAGTLSLSKELRPAAQLPVEPGDVYIRGGSPGHALLVLDVATTADGRTYMLLGQGYMPAQDFHVLRNPAAQGTDAWYHVPCEGPLHTPEWTFQWDDRKRWP